METFTENHMDYIMDIYMWNKIGYFEYTKIQLYYRQYKFIGYWNQPSTHNTEVVQDTVILFDTRAPQQLKG